MPSQAKKKPKPNVGAASVPRFRVVGKDEPAKPSGLDFGALAKPAAAKKTSSKPTLDASGELLEHLEQFVEHKPTYSNLEKLVGSKGSITSALKPLIAEAFFARFAGVPFDSSTVLTKASDKDVKLVVKEQYSRLCPELGQLLQLAPEAEPHFHEVNALKIEFDKIPADKQQPLVDAISAAVEKFGITEGITVGKCVQPKPGFHAQRTTLFDADVNARINAVIPITAYAQL